jgi:Uma2 family endonuclease
MVIQKRTYTYKEFVEFQDLPENADRIFELIEGEMVEKMPSFMPSKIGMRIGRLVGNFVDENEIGYVTGADGGYVLSDEDTFNPDVAYISKHLPEIPRREVIGPPDCAVEVKSLPIRSAKCGAKQRNTWRMAHS